MSPPFVYSSTFPTRTRLHSNALISEHFARDYSQRGMLAYVETIQRQERKNGVDVLQHQKWSGANYYDNMIKTVQGGIASTAAMGKVYIGLMLVR